MGKMADAIPWEVFEKKYSRLFKGKNGRVAKPLRLALGSLIIQTKYQYSDRELVEQLTENPYYQYFIGFPGYQEEPPIDASTLVLFRKRLKMDVIMEANEYMLDAVKEKESSDKRMMIITIHLQEEKVMGRIQSRNSSLKIKEP